MKGKIKKLFIPFVLLLIVLFSVSVSASWFRPDAPPPIVIAPGYYCTTSGYNMSGDIYMNSNTIWNATLWYSTIYNATVIDITQINGSVDIDGNLTADYFIGNGSQLTGILNTHVAGDGIYLYNDSTTMYLNETKLNATVDSRISESVGYSPIRWLGEGVNASGANGAINRVINIENTETSSGGLVAIDNYLLIQGIDYAISHLATNSTITILNELYNTQNIMVDYLVQNSSLRQYYVNTYLGSDASGISGTVDRSLEFDSSINTTAELISVDNFVLIQNVDYTLNKTSSSDINFLNRIYDDQNIMVRYFK